MWVIVKDKNGDLHKITEKSLQNEFKDSGFVIVRTEQNERTEQKKKSIKN